MKKLAQAHQAGKCNKIASQEFGTPSSQTGCEQIEEIQKHCVSEQQRSL